MKKISSIQCIILRSLFSIFGCIRVDEDLKQMESEWLEFNKLDVFTVLSARHTQRSPIMSAVYLLTQLSSKPLLLQRICVKCLCTEACNSSIVLICASTVICESRITGTKQLWSTTYSAWYHTQNQGIASFAYLILEFKKCKMSLKR